MTAVMALARVYVDDLASAEPLYQRLSAAEPHRFTHGALKLARVGPFLLVEGADDEVRSHAATIAVIDLDAILDTLDEAEAEILDGPGDAANGRRLVARHPDGTIMEYIEVSSGG